MATVTAGILSCESPAAWFTAEGCDPSLRRNARSTYISLFLGTSCDIFTDLLSMLFLMIFPCAICGYYGCTEHVAEPYRLVMFLPLALIRNLQMHWKRKLTVAALFGLGWVCIATATIRAAYLGSDVTQRVSNGAKFKVPSPPWLALWAMVESAIGMSGDLVSQLASRLSNISDS